MPLYKKVDGKRIKLTPIEELRVLGQWKSNDEDKRLTDYIRLRRQNYPSIESQLEAIYEIIAMLKGSRPLGELGKKWVRDIEEVNQKYPKPD